VIMNGRNGELWQRGRFVAKIPVGEAP